LPDDIKKRLNLESRGRGRIWRIVAEREGMAEREKALRKPGLRKAATKDLVAHLADANIWWRLTAQRLLVERQDREAVKPLEALAVSPQSAVGRAHALWTLHGLKALSEERIEQALKDTEAGVREQALRLAEERLASSEKLRKSVVALADDPSPRVRFQFAFTAGAVETKEMTAALARVARRDAADPWTQTAVLSSARKSAPALLEALLNDKEFLHAATPGGLQLLTRLAGLIGAGADDAGLARALGLLGATSKEIAPWQVALLDGLGQGLQNSARPLARLWEQPPPALREAVAKTRPLFDQAAATAEDEKRSPTERAAAVRLLGRGPFALVEKAAPALLTPQSPSDLQLAAVRALAAHQQPRVAEMLLASWTAYSPTVRREVQEALFARRDRLPALLDALEHKKVQANQIDPARLEQLRKHPDARLRERAQKLLAGLVATDRQKVIDTYQAALTLKADKAQGKAVFKKNCATCHRLEDEGVEVGPDLLSALRNKSREQLLIDILDPSREVDPRYLNYVVTTKKGETLTGLIAAETASSITLRRGEKAEDTLLRTQIDEIQATSKSLMPEGLEMQLSQQDVADVIAYLQAVAVPK
jgi:putative heme-binding domain-containing protein